MKSVFSLFGILLITVVSITAARTWASTGSNTNDAEWRTAILAKWQPGSITSGVTSNEIGASYHVYIPTTFDPHHPPPLVFAFSPDGHGKKQLNAMQKSAENAGWIVIGCDKLKNGMEEGQRRKEAIEIEDAIIADVQSLIPHDTNRVYLSGMSGGAMRSYRLAARRTDLKIAGILAFGGWLGGEEYQKTLAFPAGVSVAMVNGDKDNNSNGWVASDANVLERYKCTVKYFSFPGTHQMAPPNVIDEAIAWIQTQPLPAERSARKNAAMQNIKRDGEDYFEPLDLDNIGPCYITVQAVTDDTPAARGGLLPRDQILGIENRRIYTAFDYRAYMSINRFDTDMSVNIRRQGEDLTLLFKDIPDSRMTGCDLTETIGGPSQLGILEDRWDLYPRDYLDRPLLGSDKATRDKLTAMQRSSGQEPFSVYTDPTLIQLGFLPGRARVALWRLGTKHTEEQREWIIGFLKVYCALTEERYADVKALVEKYNLLETTLDPFLSEQIDFFRRVAETPPSSENGIPLGKYGVSPTYFALCFPYPVVPEKRTDWFAFDRKFEEAFTLGTSGSMDIDRELLQRAFYWTGKAKNMPPSAEAYMTYVAASLICSKHMGGWPTRYSKLYSPEDVAALLAELKDRAERHPDAKVLSAFTLLAPSYLGNDLATFATAYQTLMETGTREAAAANRIIYALKTKRRSKHRPKHLAVRAAIEKKFYDVPDIYAILSRHSVIFKQRSECGYYFIYNTLIQELGAYCKDHPQEIVSALEEIQEEQP